MTDDKNVTLQALLASREARAARQQALLAQYGGVLLSVTLNIPGPVKDRPAYRAALQAGVQRIRDRLPADSVRHAETRSPVSGPEVFLVLDGMALSGRAAKAMAVAVEEQDELGRLLDIDVLTPDGGISRQALDLPPRRCLLCDRDARLCARAGRHPLPALLAAVEQRLRASGIPADAAPAEAHKKSGGDV